jgi:hypothetical protein
MAHLWRQRLSKAYSFNTASGQDDSWTSGGMNREFEMDESGTRAGTFFLLNKSISGN